MPLFPRLLAANSDLINGASSSIAASDGVNILLKDEDSSQILVAFESVLGNDSVIIGVNSRDRPGLLHNISKGILRLNLQCQRTEAAVVGLRSLSVWRCERLHETSIGVEIIWEVLKVRLWMLSTQKCFFPSFFLGLRFNTLSSLY